MLTKYLKKDKDRDCQPLIESLLVFCAAIVFILYLCSCLCVESLLVDLDSYACEVLAAASICMQRQRSYICEKYKWQEVEAGACTKAKA